MKQGMNSETKKVTLVIQIAGEKKPIKKDALVCAKTGKVIRFVDTKH